MYLREAPTQTLSQLRESLASEAVGTSTVALSDVRVNVPEGLVSIGEREVPLGETGLRAFGDLLDVPNPFLLRQPADFQQTILETLIGRQSGLTATFAFTDGGVQEIRDPSTRVIPIDRLLGVAAKVIDPAAPVREFWANTSDFRLDVFVPEGHERGQGGDPRVGDIALAGVRITQDRKHNLAPSAQPFSYRLVCTNGLTTRDEGLKVDARGSSVEEVLAEFEQIADLAFRRAEAAIEALYDLRSQTVTNPERTLLRMATEAGLPNRTVTRLLERVPAALGEDGRATMFDLVNLITNEANNPALRRAGARLALEAAGGQVVDQHAERCNVCQSALVH